MSLDVHDTHLYHWNFLEGHHDRWNTYLRRIYHVRGDIPPWTILPFVFRLSSPEFEPFIHPWTAQFSIKAQGPMYDLGL